MIVFRASIRPRALRPFEWLAKAIEYGDPGLTGVAVEDLFDNIHEDPRWLPFLRTIGKAPEHLANIEFKVTSPQAESATATVAAHRQLADRVVRAVYPRHEPIRCPLAVADPEIGSCSNSWHDAKRDSFGAGVRLDGLG